MAVDFGIWSKAVERSTFPSYNGATEQGNQMVSALGYSEESALDKSKLMYKLLDRFAKDLETQLEGNGLEINVKTLKAGALALMTIYGQIYPLIESAVSTLRGQEEGRGALNVHVDQNLNFF